eukprot:scaffold117532_cov75-Phaeocystis_antarctica.AAC.1
MPCGRLGGRGQALGALAVAGAGPLGEGEGRRAERGHGLGAALGLRRRRGLVGREGGVELLLGHDGARGAAHLGEARSDGLGLGDGAGDEEAGLGARDEERHEVRAQRVHRLGHADAVDLREHPLAVVGAQLEVRAAPRGGEGRALGGGARDDGVGQARLGARELHLGDAQHARGVVLDDLLRGEVSGQRVGAAVEREGEHAAVGVIAQPAAVGEARPAQLDPEVALERGEVLDDHAQRGVVRVRGCDARRLQHDVGGLGRGEGRDDRLDRAVVEQV